MGNISFDSFVGICIIFHSVLYWIYLRLESGLVQQSAQFIQHLE